MNLQYIRYALEIARTGSISKAAENLSVAQPNLSRAVKELEGQLGISIFERTRTGMTVTPMGEQLLSAGERILRDVNDLETMFTGESRPRLSLTVTVMPTAYLTHAFTTFCASLPADERFSVTWRESSLNDTVEDVAQGISKLGIIRIPLHFAGYYTELLASRELQCEAVAEFAPAIVVGQGSPLAAKETVTAAELSALCEIACPESLPSDGGDGSRADCRREITAEGTHTGYSLVASDTEAYLCVPPLPLPILNQYGLTQRPLARGASFCDLLVTPKTYRLTETDEAFLRALRGTVKHYMT